MLCTRSIRQLIEPQRQDCPYSRTAAIFEILALLLQGQPLQTGTSLYRNDHGRVVIGIQQQIPIFGGDMALR
jgi:hypothetical protein